MENTPKLKVMQAIHAFFAAFIGGTLMVVLYLRYQKYGTIYNEIPEDGFLNFMAPAFAVIMLIAGSLLFRNKIAAVATGTSFETRIATYQVAMLIRLACFEAGAMFNLISFHQSGGLFCLLAALVMLAAIVFIRPIKERVVVALKLEYPETEKLGVS